jgi:hypothetical protein
LPEKSKKCRFPFVLLMLLSLVMADGIITEFVVSTGMSIESNPLMRVCLSEGNILSVKVCGGILSALVLWDIHRKNQRLAEITSLIFIALYTVIVYWNIAGIFIS